MQTPAEASASGSGGAGLGSSDNAQRCAICLLPIQDRTKGACQHEFCFKCIGVWANQSRRCPLCNADMGEHFTHDLDHNPPTKFFLAPLPENSSIRRRVVPKAFPSSPVAPANADDQSLERRRRVYAHGVYAKHIAANGYTGFARTLTPREIDPSRALEFLKRELQIWTDDAPSLAAHIVHLLSAVDVRSDAAVLLLEPLVGDAAAQHLAHELYSFLRAQRALEEWDDLVQYDEVAGEPVREVLRQKRARSDSASSSRSRRSSRGRSYSYSRSPSRDLAKPDSFRPSPSPGGKRWDEADSWIDPEYAEELRRRREPKRRRESRQSREPRPLQSNRGRELLDRMSPGGVFGAAEPEAGLVIRGAAERRASLLERLAKVKGGDGGDGKADATGNGHEPPKNDRAQELRERLLAEKKKRVLKEQLMARKRARGAIVEAAEERRGEVKAGSEAKSEPRAEVTAE